MTYMPINSAPVSTMISAASPESNLFLVQQSMSTSYASTTWPVANEAIFIPFSINRPTTIYQLWVANGTLVLGDFDLGIYTFDGKRIVSLGSTAQSGATTIQTNTITNMILSPGQYYLAMAMDSNASSTRVMAASNAGTWNYGRVFGAYLQTSAFPLPATAIFATGTTYIPLFGVATVPTV